MREFRVSPRLGRRLALDALMILFLTLTGPFGTFVDLPAYLRLAYWTLAVAGCGFFMHLAITTALALDRLAGWPRMPRIALGALVAAVPGATLIGVLEAMFRANYLAVDHYLWFWFCVAAIGMLMGTVHYGMFTSSPARTSNTEPPQPVSPFLRRIPPELGRQLISLSMQDHYAKVTTTRGSAMLLIRFADAVRELEPYPGAQVHRSHWVAQGKARRIINEKNRKMIELVDGRRVPVSRPYLHNAKALIGPEPYTVNQASPVEQ